MSFKESLDDFIRDWFDNNKPYQIEGDYTYEAMKATAEWVRDYKKWISIEESLPDYNEEVEVSFDGGKTVECIAMFKETTQCIVQKFHDEFEQVDVGLVLLDVTHWRYL